MPAPARPSAHHERNRDCVYVEPGTPAEGLAAPVAEARSVLHRADDVFSTWKLDSPLSRLRRGEATLDQMPPRSGGCTGGLPGGA